VSWTEGEVCPATRAEAARAVAAARGPLMPSGRGTALGRGLPPAVAPRRLDLSRLDRVIEHEVGDFTVTAEAGISLEALNRKLAEAGQWLPPCHTGAGAGSLGGLIGTDRRNALAGRYGGIREFLLGMTYLNPGGEPVRVGARVVKSVAGYDLMKAFTGALGQLGPVLEVTLRVLPAPRAWRVVSWPGPLDQAAFRALWYGVPRRVFPDAFVRYAEDGNERFAVLLAGSEARVAGLTEAARALAGAAARVEIDPQAFFDLGARFTGDAGGGFGGMDPGLARDLAPPSGAVLVDLLDGHLWWQPAPGDAGGLAAIRGRIGDGVLHWEDREPARFSWGADGGREGEWWRRLKEALDPGGAWVSGRWPGAR